MTFEPCRPGSSDRLCATLPVFENREAKSGRKIGLYIVLLPAKAEKAEADPVFGLAGGPGQSAADAFPFATYILALRQQHDIVLIDHRGTGKSNPLHCPSDRMDAQAMINGPASVPDLPGCRAELEKRADLTQYTTSNFADDVDEVRAAMGYEKIDVIGGSYAHCPHWFTCGGMLPMFVPWC